MNYYHALDSDLDFPIKSKGNHISEYQDLVDDFLAKGGKIKFIPEGVRAKEEFDVGNYFDATDYVDHKPKGGGKTIMDQIEDGKSLPKGLEMGGEFSDH